MANTPKHVPRTGDKGHPNPRPPQSAGKGSVPGQPGHSGPGGPKSKDSKPRNNSGFYRDSNGDRM